jgi:hypothetical protein
MHGADKFKHVDLAAHLGAKAGSFGLGFGKGFVADGWLPAFLVRVKAQPPGFGTGWDHFLFAVWD